MEVTVKDDRLRPCHGRIRGHHISDAKVQYKPKEGERGSDTASLRLRMGHAIGAVRLDPADQTWPPALFPARPEKSLQLALQAFDGGALSYPVRTQHHAKQAAGLKPCANAPERSIPSAVP